MKVEHTRSTCLHQAAKGKLTMMGVKTIIRNIFDMGENWRTSPPVIRRILLAALVSTSIFSLIWALTNPSVISMPIATMYGSFISLTAVAVGFYFKKRGDQDVEEEKREYIEQELKKATQNYGRMDSEEDDTNANVKTI